MIRPDRVEAAFLAVPRERFVSDVVALADIVGSRGRVTSVDVDADLARQARRSLRDAGYRVSIKVGDSRQGYPEAAPMTGSS